jgi:hypothetical protein
MSNKPIKQKRNLKIDYIDDEDDLKMLNKKLIDSQSIEL